MLAGTAIVDAGDDPPGAGAEAIAAGAATAPESTGAALADFAVPERGARDAADARDGAGPAGAGGVPDGECLALVAGGTGRASDLPAGGASEAWHSQPASAAVSRQSHGSAEAVCQAWQSAAPSVREASRRRLGTGFRVSDGG